MGEGRKEKKKERKIREGVPRLSFLVHRRTGDAGPAEEDAGAVQGC